MNLESDIYDLLCGRASERVCNAIQKYEGIKQIKDLIKEDGSFVGGLGKPPKIPNIGKKSIAEIEYMRRWFVENHLQGPKTIILADFNKQDRRIMSDIIYDSLQDRDINAASFAFSIEVEYTEEEREA